jgi:NDP-sugar pyrophosphorylase family protein
MGMKCLILVAGKGRRLQQRGDSNPLIPILGIPLIERVIRATLETGAVRILVAEGCAKAIPVSGFWIDVDDPTASHRQV